LSAFDCAAFLKQSNGGSHHSTHKHQLLLKWTEEESPMAENNPIFKQRCKQSSNDVAKSTMGQATQFQFYLLNWFIFGCALGI
jgi:hypothetical protein